MANFKYKFKTIKDVKQRLEKKTQKELAVIELDISNKKEEILIINEKLKENRKKKNESRIKKITELHFYEKYENYLEEQIKLIQKYINKKTVERNKKIEELINELKQNYTIIIVTHNMQQASRVSDRTAFFYMGELVEFGKTTDIFTNPTKKQTENYISGRFG